MENNKKWYKEIISYAGIVLGVMISAVAFNFFLEPNNIAPGGVTGLAIVIRTVTGIPIYLTNLIINIPLFIIGVVVLGKAFGAKTLFATFGLSFFLKIVPYRVATEDLLLASVFGGILLGFGLGLVFKSGGTTGGTDLAGAILNKCFPRVSISSYMMAIDGIVVAIAGLASRKLEISLYSVIALYLVIKVINTMLEGVGYVKAFLIITEKPEELGQAIMRDIQRGVTLFKGKGMYTKEEKDILLCVVNRSQFTKLKELVNAIDAKAFLMVTDMYEVIGEGFQEIKK
ncbi:YitT family protein [Anaerosalibacter sp. Marseille-P3206]|uniref:YitT family protein n=1 Tax=Anaerosalibacter sp. Marseille-P3206 TaxID=1871005 RepID=UPI001F2D3F80|nr:YitT family protein [Anaerosalibacter sp. Marseille-P3206]